MKRSDWLLLIPQWGFNAQQNYPPMLSAWSKTRLNFTRVVEVTSSGVFSMDR
jgi:hypothetical protein